MRIGDIIVNPWVSRYFDGELNPNYATIYLGDNESLDYQGRRCKWADKVYKDNPARETPWKVIGHIDLYGIAELAIRDAVYDEENKDEPLNQVKPTLAKNEPSLVKDLVKTENSSEKPNNCETHTEVETMSCAECKHRPIGAEICEEACHYEPQTDWHYDEQDATWYPYKHEDEPQQKSCATCKHALGNWDGESNNCGRCCGADRRFYEPKDEPQTDCAWK